MPTEDATPVIFFIVSLYAFAVVLLYVLARAWEQALSTRRPVAGKGAGSRTSMSSHRPTLTFRSTAEAVDAKIGRGEARD